MGARSLCGGVVRSSRFWGQGGITRATCGRPTARPTARHSAQSSLPVIIAELGPKGQPLTSRQIRGPEDAGRSFTCELSFVMRFPSGISRKFSPSHPTAEIVNAGQENVSRRNYRRRTFTAATPKFRSTGQPPSSRVDCGGFSRRPPAWITASSQPLSPADEIVVTSASGLFADQVAEQTLALLLGLVRSLPVFFRAQQRHDFTRRPTSDLHGKAVGILGFGGNGRRLAKILAAFRCRILATDKFPIHQPDYVEALWPAEQYVEVLAQSDIVDIVCPAHR